MFARKIFISIIIFLLFTGTGQLHGQSAYMNTQEGIFRLTGSAGSCEHIEVPNECGVDHNLFSIAVYKDTIYYNTWTGDLIRFKIGSPGSCERLLAGEAIFNAMTVDRNGIIYMAGSELVRFDPHTKQLSHLGDLPFTSMGDLTFYKDKLLMAGYDPFDWSTGIYEINIEHPDSSRLYMSTPPFIGLLSYPVPCGNSRYFGLYPDNMGTTQLVELSLENRTVIGESCIMQMEVLDAASNTETGLDSKVTIADLTINKSCSSSTGSAHINAIYPGNGDITYTLDNAVTNTTGLFNGITSGVHYIKASSPGGTCTLDTSFTIEPGYDLVTGISKTNPDACSNIKGSITIDALQARGAITFTLLNNGTSQPTGNFDGLRGGLYKFRISNTGGCTRDTSIALVENIPVGGCNEIFIPNAFTPNYDGKNDAFIVMLPTSFKNIALQVFNRWGNIVCQARGNTVSWDGNYKGMQQPEGVYVYTLVFIDPNGVQKTMKGTLTMIR